MTTPIAIAVVEHEGRFLVGQRPPGVPLAGLWEFPGGKIEAGETPEAAAVRECLEETGLAALPLFCYPEHLHEYEHGRVQLAFIACRLADGAVSQARPPYRWADRSELKALSFPAANTQLIESLTNEAKPNR
jgi:8-oxo-dGTP diphosphatase